MSFFHDKNVNLNSSYINPYNTNNCDSFYICNDNQRKYKRRSVSEKRKKQGHIEEHDQKLPKNKSIKPQKYSKIDIISW